VKLGWCLIFGAAVATGAQCQLVTIPAPSGYPLSQTASNDPLVALSHTSMTMESFRPVIAAALASSPLVGERAAGRLEAEAVRREARSAQFPVIDLSFSANRSLARNFSNNPDNVLESSRGSGRVDATASVQQLIYVFGASGRRVAAAAARIEGATADYERARESLALRAIGAWSDLFAFTQLGSIATAHAAQLESLRSAVDLRIRQGVSARIDRSRLTSVIVSAQARLADFERQRENARARYIEIFKDEPPVILERVPMPDTGTQSREVFLRAAESSPLVKVAEAQARAASLDARASQASSLPNVTAGIDAGRYGLFENDRNDYDVRARVTIRQQLLGPGPARTDQAKARANAAQLRAQATRDEAIRETSIAWSDVQSLTKTIAARQDDYIANRQLRDAESERFKRTRGSLFDVLAAQERTFVAGSLYLQSMIELDTSHYVLLARSGQLLSLLGINAASSGYSK
jgi:outer membrane protein, adhesin transport system